MTKAEGKTRDIPYFEDTTVEISTNKGVVSVPAIHHKYCPGLAITMQNFGYFVVTHIPTGLKMTDMYERAASATLVLSKYCLIASEYNFSWADLDQISVAEKFKEIGHNLVPFEGYEVTFDEESKGTSIAEWIKGLRFMNFHGVVDEFPWEEINKESEAMKNLERCQA